jgi:ferrochelatase
MLAPGKYRTMTQQSPSTRWALAPGAGPEAGGRIGVLLVNLGSPSGTDTASVRRYLREFLSDPRVIEVPRPIWWLVLNFAVLTTRPPKTAHAYRQVWNNERNEAPLVTITRAQAEKLGQALAGDGFLVDWAMRYGERPVGERLKAMHAAGCERILLAPLYPQYSAATTATVNDVAFRTLVLLRRQPALRTLPAYYDDAGYIDALAASVTGELAKLDFTPQVVLASYHGLPKASVEKGDPYYHQCLETTRLLRERLGWGEDRLRIAFQSRFGRAEWLQPYFDATLTELPKQGIGRIAVLMPGFSADCLETLEEIAIRGKETFLESGGKSFAAIPCLNDSAVGIAMLEKLVRRELAGWA